MEIKLGLKEAVIILLAVVILTLLAQMILTGKYHQAMQIVQQQEQVIQRQQQGIALTNELLNRLYTTGKWSPAEFARLGYKFEKKPDLPKEKP